MLVDRDAEIDAFRDRLEVARNVDHFDVAHRALTSSMLIGESFS